MPSPRYSPGDILASLEKFCCLVIWLDWNTYLIRKLLVCFYLYLAYLRFYRLDFRKIFQKSLRLGFGEAHLPLLFCILHICFYYC